MATKVKTGVIDSSAITSALIANASITADDLHTTLDLTGKTVTVATATAGDNDTSVASTAFVSTAIANLADSAPSTLNTLNELAAALGDDASFSTTVTNSIATKLPLAGGTLTGDLVITSNGDGLKLIRSGYDSYSLQQSTGNGLAIYNITDSRTELFFTGDGKVGIGTTAPGSAAGSLSVYGTGTSSPSASNAATSYSNAMFRINHFVNSSVGLSIGSAGGNTTYIQSSYNEGTTSPLLINPYASDAETSFVGIGPITAPVASVHIKPTGNSWRHGLLLQHPAANTGWMLHPETQDNSLWFGYNADTAVAIGNQTATEYVVFDSSGGVGIGNSRPTANAHAYANNLVIGNTSTSNNGMSILGNANHTGRIFFGDPDLDRSGQIEYVHNGDTLQFYTGNALSTKMTEGRLGIGVTPSEVFHTYVASGSNEYRNQLGSNSVYMRHGVTRSTPQGANVFDIHALQNQDIVIGTSNMFLVGDGGVHNSEGSNRLRVDGTGVTIGEVLPTLTTTNESVERRLWVRGQGVFHSQDQGTLLPRARTSALNIGPSASRGTTGNPGTAAYNATTPTGHVSGGIAWDHLMNYSSYGNMGYNGRPHGWLGMEVHSTPGYELSNMIMCTKEGSTSTSEPLVAQRWYATGEITTPRNPAFTAYGTGLANQGTEGNHGTWNETIDRGGNFTPGTNAHFTAPVDGLYAFWAQCNFNTGSSTPYYWRAFKNTAGAGIFYGSGANQSWDHIMAYIMIAMDKNDTFEWRYRGDPDEGAEWAQCGGYLVG